LKPCFNALRNVLTSTFVAAALATTVFSSAQTTLQQTSNVQALADTNWATTLAVPQFTSSLGTLTSVTVTLNWSTYQSVVTTNNDVSDQYVYGTESDGVSITLPDGSTLSGTPAGLTIGSVSVVGILTIPVGDVPVAGLLSAGPITTTSTTVSTTYTTAAAMAAYVGTGNVSFPATATGAFSETDSGGNLAWTVTTQAGASVTVSYVYTPAGGSNNNTGPGGSGSGSGTSTICGTVYNNCAGDGYCGHSTETGIGSGVEVCAYTCQNKLVSTAYTNSQGCYTLTGLLPCTTYKVVICTNTLPSGYVLSCHSNSVNATTPKTGSCCGENFAACKSNTGCGYTTLKSSDWGCNDWSGNNCGILRNCYSQVFPDSNCSIGGNNGSCVFDGCRAIECYVQQNGNGCPLPKGCQVDPNGCNEGTLAGETLACKLNCSFSDAGVFCSGFKNLVCQSGPFKGHTVASVCNAAQCYLDGEKTIPGVPHCSSAQLTTCLQQINSSYCNNNNNGGWGGNNGGWGNNNNNNAFCK